MRWYGRTEDAAYTYRKEANGAGDRETRERIIGMKSSSLVLIAFIAIVTLSSCGDVRSDVFTTSNTAQVMQAVSASHLSDDDKRKVLAAAMRATFGAYNMAGKTVGQVIDDETSFEEQQNAQQLAQQQQEQREAQAAEAERQEMQRALSVQVLSKSFVPADPMNSGTYEDSIALTIQFHNTGSKVVRAIKGFLAFNNQFGDRIYRVDLDVEQGSIAAGALYTSTYSIDYNQFEDDMVRLKNTDLANMRVQWVPLSIIFGDGSQVSADDPDSEATTP